jgi:DNA-binding CsgD family transcriptional regulator
MPKQKPRITTHTKYVLLHTDEVASLERFARSPNASLRDRAQTILARFEQGFHDEQIAQFLRKQPSTIRCYLADFRKYRLASLCSLHFGNQNAAKLTKEEKRCLEAVLADPPSVYGLPGEFWDVPSVQTYTSAHLSLTYASPESYRALQVLRLQLP